VNDHLGTWFPAAVLIVIGGMYGHLLGSLPRRPAWRKRAYFVHILLLALGGLFVMVGLILRFAGDDPTLANHWLVPGAIFMAVIGLVTPALRRLIR
jgi:hypothetical protein